MKTTTGKTYKVGRLIAAAVALSIGGVVCATIIAVGVVIVRAIL